MKSNQPKTLFLKNIRKGVATNSSSTHSVIYKNDKDKMFKDIGILDNNYYGRFDTVVATSREAKIKYILAHIFRNEPLVSVLENKFPEFKKYYPLIKQEMEHKYDLEWEAEFGMYPRTALYPENDIYASVEIIENIIEDPTCIIVGGSDEMDDVMNIIGDHECLPKFYEPKKVFKNGNYYIVNDWLDMKLRACVERQHTPIPEYPELIDVNLTNYCTHACKCCYRACDANGEHASIVTVSGLIYGLSIPTELVLGGGNVLDYPELNHVVNFANEKGHSVSMTIHASDYMQVQNLKCIDNIKGLGVSVFNKLDVKRALTLHRKYSFDKHVALHIIPEYLGYKKTLELLQYLNDLLTEADLSCYVVFLGYKYNGRGANYNPNKLTDDQLMDLFSVDKIIASTDTCFNNNYKEFMLREYDELSLTFNEGEYSMYFDAVKCKAYRSSYQTEKEYPFNPGSAFPSKNLKQVFEEIRKDGGFEIYQPKHYWEK